MDRKPFTFAILKVIKANIEGEEAKNLMKIVGASMTEKGYTLVLKAVQETNTYYWFICDAYHTDETIQKRPVTKDVIAAMEACLPDCQTEIQEGALIVHRTKLD